MRTLILASSFLFLMLGGLAGAEEVNFICKNKDNKEREYILAIDLKNKIMKRAGANYKINSITENYIFANKKYKLDDINGEIILTFNRLTGDLLYRDSRNGLKFDFADFACKKAGEKLI